MNDPLIGKQLANFRVERLLGQGGMATVYYGWDVKLHRSVAIKVLDKRYRKHPAYATRFVNEARMMAKWRHENIIQIYYADDAQGFSYYVMDYVDGEDLSTFLDSYSYEGKLISQDEVLRIGRAVASALDYAHKQGVIHRDVKPSNILLSKDGRVLLGDFGMALDVQDGTQGNVFGTPHYISPEQARRSTDSVPQSDLYSFGVILYEMLTGTVPFNDESPQEIALKHIAQPPLPPRSVNQNLSKEVENVLLHALEKNPKNRYQSGAELINALESALNKNKTPSPAPKNIPLPPLPVGAPTIQRDDATGKIAKRKTPVEQMPPTVIASHPNRKKNVWIYGIFLFILLGFGAFYFFQNRFNVVTVLPTPTLDSTPLPSPTTVLPTSTSAPPQATFTPTLISPTSTITPTATLALPTVLYPEGNLFTLFYNETSFVMINRSFAKRSISAFVFERLDENGNPSGERFEGYQWETRTTKHLPRNYCVNFTVYGDQDPPYLYPAECLYGLMSSVQARFDNPGDLIFWSSAYGYENATQFRVLWAGSEVARCEIEANVCDVYIP
ncbi:MAG: protein kinase [Anaerolineales bacterium]|nr:protein kinase [Anaerolineales bacterium]